MNKLVGTALTAALALGASATVGAEAASQAAEQPAPQAATADSLQGLRAVRDKETGQLRAPTKAELDEMLAKERADRRARGLPEASAEPTPIAVRQHSSGMVSAVLGPDFLVTVIARRGPDGRLLVSHTHPEHEHPVSVPAQRPTE